VTVTKSVYCYFVLTKHRNFNRDKLSRSEMSDLALGNSNDKLERSKLRTVEDK